MKKIVIIVFALLLLAGGGGAGYYFFFMQENNADAIQEAGMESTEALKVEEDAAMADLDAMTEEQITQFYIIETRVPVRAHPTSEGIIVGYLYKGDHIESLERQGDWLRLTEFLVLSENGKEEAEWINVAAVSPEQPIIEVQEQMEILDGYLEKSDDYKQYQAIFRKQTKVLLEQTVCKPEDFEELGGWVRSVTYQESNVYFIYCGGLEQEDKIYLDIDKEEIFYR